MKFIAVGAGAATLAVVAAAGPFVAHKISAHRAEANYDPPGAFAVTVPHPEFGDGSPTALYGARITRDGVVEVLAEGGPCEAVSHVDWSPVGAHSVETTVYVTGLGRACLARATNWFVILPDAPSDVSAVVDAAHGGARIKIVDCRGVSDAAHNICSATRRLTKQHQRLKSLPPLSPLHRQLRGPSTSGLRISDSPDHKLKGALNVDRET